MTMRATDLLPPAYPWKPATARQITMDFLTARVAINNARMAFIAEPTPANMTAWTDAEERLIDLHDVDYYPPVPETPLDADLFDDELLHVEPAPTVFRYQS